MFKAIMKAGLSFFRIFVTLMAAMAIAGPALANSLSAGQMSRLQDYKALIREVDGMSLQEDIRRLEQSGYPEQTLQIMEAMARTYTDLIREQNIQALPDRRWLFSMVQLNMAYMRLAGSPDVQGTNSLNRMIIKKLRSYLPETLMRHPAFFDAMDS